MVEAPPYCVVLVRMVKPVQRLLDTGLLRDQSPTSYFVYHASHPPSPRSGSVGGRGRCNGGENRLVQEAMTKKEVCRYLPNPHGPL